MDVPRETKLRMQTEWAQWQVTYLSGTVNMFAVGR